MKNTINTDFIRTFVKNSYVKIARSRGNASLSIPVRAVEEDLRKVGLPSGRVPMVCSALRSKKFRRENDLVLDRWDGPESGQSTTVVFHFHFADSAVSPNAVTLNEGDAETPMQRALRAGEEMRGLLRDEIAKYGGTEGFMRWVRSDEDEEA